MLKLVEFAWKLVLALRPSADGDPMIQLAWRQTVASVVGALVLVVLASGLWMGGDLAFAGLSGVALASDLAALDAKFTKKTGDSDSALNNVQLILVKNGIKGALEDRCFAYYAKNQPALRSANAELDGYREQFRLLTGYAYDVPNCDVVLISNAASPVTH